MTIFYLHSLKEAGISFRLCIPLSGIAIPVLSIIERRLRKGMAFFLFHRERVKRADDETTRRSSRRSEGGWLWRFEGFGSFKEIAAFYAAIAEDPSRCSSDVYSFSSSAGDSRMMLYSWTIVAAFSVREIHPARNRTSEAGLSNVLLMEITCLPELATLM
jgi:hypothetical protein